MDHTKVSAEEFAGLDGLAAWQLAGGSIEADFRAGSYLAAAQFVLVIATASETANHHPDIDLRYPDRVRVVLTTHAARGLTTLDIDLAKQISLIAGDTGISLTADT